MIFEWEWGVEWGFLESGGHWGFEVREGEGEVVRMSADVEDFKKKRKGKPVWQRCWILVMWSSFIW